MGTYDERIETACQVMKAAEAGDVHDQLAVEMSEALSQSCWSDYTGS